MSAWYVVVLRHVDWAKETCVLTHARSTQQRYRAQYAEQGMRRSVYAALLVQNHGHPHVLLLEDQSDKTWLLPGGKLKPGESEAAGLRRKLSNKLAPVDGTEVPEWDIGELLGSAYRPSFESPALYPYLPAHVTRPKELSKLFLVPLPEHCVFAVPRNMKIMAVPLFELHSAADKYGPLIAMLPTLLSRFSLVFA